MRLFFLFILLLSCACAANTENVHTQTRHLYSKMTKQDYALEVNLPAHYYDYDKRFQSYSALFIFEQNNFISPAFYSLLNIPGLFVFQIKADTHTDNFSDFLQSELIPTLSRNFHLNGKRTLVCAKNNAYYANQLLREKPALFDSYILIDPDFSSNGIQNPTQTLPAKLFMVATDAEHLNNIAQYSHTLNTENHLGLNLRFEDLHGSQPKVMLQALNDGLNYIYQT